MAQFNVVVFGDDRHLHTERGLRGELTSAGKIVLDSMTVVITQELFSVRNPYAKFVVRFMPEKADGILQQLAPSCALGLAIQYRCR